MKLIDELKLLPKEDGFTLFAVVITFLLTTLFFLRFV